MSANLDFVTRSRFLCASSLSFSRHLSSAPCLLFVTWALRTFLGSTIHSEHDPSVLFSLKTLLSPGPFFSEPRIFGPCNLLLWGIIQINQSLGGYGFNAFFKKWISRRRQLLERNNTDWKFCFIFIKQKCRYLKRGSKLASPLSQSIRVHIVETSPPVTQILFCRQLNLLVYDLCLSTDVLCICEQNILSLPF